MARHGTAPSALLDVDPSPSRLPFALAGLLAQLRATDTRCEMIAADLVGTWAIPDPLGAAVVLIARDADRSGIANAYHNPAHTRDVLINWANLAMCGNALAAAGHAAATLAAEDLALGLCAALGHDVLHDGSRNESPRGAAGAPADTADHAFRLERNAAARTVQLLRQAGVADALARPVAAAILATEPVHGLASFRQAPELASPGWRLMALTLRDADVLASVALTAAEHDRQSGLLGLERGMDLNTPDAAEALFAQAEAERLHSPAGQLFRPQLRVLRAVNRLRADRPPPGWSLAETASRVAGL